MKLIVRNTFTRICMAALVLLIVGLTALDSLAVGQETKRVFVLNSYHRGYPFSDNAMLGIDDAFGKSGIKAETYVTYMDMKRIPTTPQYFSKLKELIRVGYKGARIDAVIACDNDALEFMRKYRDELFPGVPVVFTGINDFDKRMLDGRSDITGISQSNDYAGTIRIAQKFRPATKDIVVVTDNTTTGMAHRSAIVKIRPDFPQSLGFTYLSLADMTLDELAEKLSKLNSDSIVLLLHHFVDRNGTGHSIQESTSLLAKSSSVPIFVVSDIRMGFGTLGGHLVGGYSQGEAAAQIAVKILGGTDVRTIPVLLESPNRFMFDYNVMKRFSIAEGDLPQGSIMINKPVSILEEYKPQLFAILGTFIVLSGILVYMLLEIMRRKRAEESLRNSESKYQFLAESMADVVFTLDINLVTTYVSPSIERMLGFTPEERMVQKVDQQLTPKSQELVFEILVAELDREKEKGPDPDRSQTLALEYYHKDGSIKHLVTYIRGIRDSQGILTGFYGSHHDITERKRAEDLLRESENRFKALAENIPGVIYLCLNDQYYSMLYLNDAVERLTGYGKDDFLENRISFVNLYHPDDAPSIAPAVEQACERREPFHLIYRIRKRDGQWRWIEEYGVGIYSQGNLLFLEGFLTDITDRKEAEEALRKSEDRLRLITDNMSDMIRVADLQGVNLYTSPSHFKGLGYRPEERVGKSAFDIIHPDDLERIINLFSEGLAANRRVNVEYRVRHADGHYVWLETVADLLRDAQGKTTAVVMSSRDITDRKQAEEEKRSMQERLNRAEKMEALGQLAGGVAHDLNNVLGVLSGYSELLLLETPKGHRSRGHAEKILHSTEKGAAIIDDLLTLARRGVTASDVVNLNSIVSDFLKTPVFESMKDYHPRVTFRTEYDKNLLNIKGSPVHVEKTLMNLVSNAAESISGTGEVTIRTESRYLDKFLQGYDEVREGDYAVLTVSDTGMGISVENREKIFEPFYTKKTMGKSGTGLGLAIVWGTVKDHNGYIDVQSKMGEGTTFTLFFPVTREEVLLPQPKETMERYLGKGESVLVVDDIAEQRDVAARLLTKLGYDVRVVSSGEEAVEYLKSNKTDILVLDMIMAPGIDGLETYQRVLGINPKQKAILVSGFSETERVKEAQKLGAGAYVKKPYVMEKVGMAIRDELDSK